MMDKWEWALATRDGVFFQLFLLTILAVVLYRLATPGLKMTLSLAGIMSFFIMFTGSVANIILWKP